MNIGDILSPDEVRMFVDAVFPLADAAPTDLSDEWVSNACLSDHTILAFHNGDLDLDDAASVEAHLRTCETCRSVLLALKEIDNLERGMNGG